MSRFGLLLRKDLLLLVRSRPLIVVLVLYPLVLSLLVGGVLEARVRGRAWPS